MATTLTIDIIDGVGVQEHKGTLTSATRAAVIQNLTPGASALTDAYAALPPVGAVHPTYTFMTLVDRDIQLIGPTIATAALKYELVGFEPPVGETSLNSGSVSLESVTTELDSTGAQITVTHAGITQGGEVQVLRPRAEQEFTKLDNLSAPGQLGLDYVGKVNSETWEGGAAHTWLCAGIAYDLEDRSQFPPLYRMRYVFRYNADEWKPGVIFIDPETGKPPPNLTDGTGFKTVTVYDEIDFSGLGL